MHVPQQFGLDVSRFPDVNPSTRARQALEAPCRWGTLRYRYCCKRSIPVIFKSKRGANCSLIPFNRTTPQPSVRNQDCA